MGRLKTHAKRSLWQQFVAWLSDDDARAPTRKDTTIRRTRQVTQTDCGVAVLSMLADVPYATARRALFRKGERCEGTPPARMKIGLRKLGVEHGARFTRFRAWSKIPGHALVAAMPVGADAGHPGHWLVFQKLARGWRLLDPDADGDTLTVADPDDYIGISFLLVDARERKRLRRARIDLAASVGDLRRSPCRFKPSARR